MPAEPLPLALHRPLHSEGVELRAKGRWDALCGQTGYCTLYSGGSGRHGSAAAGFSIAQHLGVYKPWLFLVGKINPLHLFIHLVLVQSYYQALDGVFR